MYQPERNDKVCDLLSSNPVSFRTFFFREVLFTLEREPDSTDKADLEAAHLGSVLQKTRKNMNFKDTFGVIDKNKQTNKTSILSAQISAN